MAGDLRNLPGPQLGKQLASQLFVLLLQPGNLLGEIHVVTHATAHMLEFINLSQQLGNRLFKIEKV